MHSKVITMRRKELYEKLYAKFDGKFGDAIEEMCNLIELLDCDPEVINGILEE